MKNAVTIDNVYIYIYTALEFLVNHFSFPKVNKKLKK